MDMNARKTVALDVVATHAVSKETLIERVRNHFGTALCSFEEARDAVNQLVFTRKILANETATGRVMLSTPAFRSPIAIEVEKYVVKAGSVALADVRKIVAKRLDNATPREIQGTIMGCLQASNLRKVYTAQGWIIATTDAPIETLPVPERVMSEKGAKIAATRAFRKANPDYVTPIKVRSVKGEAIALGRAKANIAKIAANLAAILAA